MLDRLNTTPAAMYLLADHLDAALAIGEDLLATRLPALADLDSVDDAAERELSRFVSRIARLEASLLGRILQARRRLAELPRQETDVQQLAGLFVAGTARLEDVVAEMAEQSAGRFDTGPDRLPFLRERGLLAPDAACLPLYESIEVGESCRLYGNIEIGPLLDMVSSLLDVLDGHHDLFCERTAADTGAAPGHAEAASSADEPAATPVDAEPALPTDRADLGGGESTAAEEPDQLADSLTPGTLAAALKALETTGADRGKAEAE